MSITKTQREALALLALEPDDENDGEIVRSGREEWIGLRRFPSGTINALLRFTLLRRSSDDADMERFTLNSVGRALLAGTVSEDDLARALASGGPFTITKDGRIEPMNPLHEERKRNG